VCCSRPRRLRLWLATSGRPKLYVEYHQRIVAAVNNCLPVTNVMSVDEMACRLMGCERAVSNATRLAMDVKEVLRGVGDTLRCSVGLAPNRYLSKLASDMLKPDGLTVLLKRDLPQALYRLKLNNLIGVGPSMEKRIRSHGIKTVEQLCRLAPDQMRHIRKSVLGERMWHWLRGADFNEDETQRKSLGKQHVLPPDLRSREQAYQVAQKLLQAAAANLRKVNMWAGGIGVYVEFVRSRYCKGIVSRSSLGRRNCASASAGTLSPCRRTCRACGKVAPRRRHCRSASGSST
jgi:DNA polymerase-4